MEREAHVWKLWLRIPAGASNALWARFNAVILRKFGPPAEEFFLPR